MGKTTIIIHKPTLDSCREPQRPPNETRYPPQRKDASNPDVALPGHLQPFVRTPGKQDRPFANMHHQRLFTQYFGLSPTSRHSGPNSTSCASWGPLPGALLTTKGSLGVHECGGTTGEEPLTGMARRTKSQMIPRKTCYLGIQI